MSLFSNTMEGWSQPPIYIHCWYAEHVELCVHLPDATSLSLLLSKVIILAFNLTGAHEVTPNPLANNLNTVSQITVLTLCLWRRCMWSHRHFVQHPTLYRICHTGSTACLGPDLHLSEGNSDLSDYLALSVHYHWVEGWDNREWMSLALWGWSYELTVSLLQGLRQ
jgi:hypothetical protein